MTIHMHILAGCSPTPLAHYLKAVGILRLVAEQKDPNCRGAWRDDNFVLATVLSREELEGFFLEAYEPTAIIDPWNGGSGFYPKGNKIGIEAILGSSNQRLGKLKDAIRWAQNATCSWTEAPKDEEKGAFQASCLKELRNGAEEAIKSALVLTPQSEKAAGTDKASYPSLLGTGWNDGRLDFANNFHQMVADVFDLRRKSAGTPIKEAEAKALARAEQNQLVRLGLWAVIHHGLRKTAIGQFSPGAAGGANSTTGPDGDSLVNPWDYILMIEGAILFSSASTKRMNPQAQAQGSAPFALYSHALGDGPVSGADEKQRGEQWMPLWDRFLQFQELRSLLGEGRAQIGKVSATRPVDMARAISRLGVARGITAFQRFAYMERNGQANFAVPLGRILVQEHPQARLIDDLAPWLDRLRRAARDKGAPVRLAQAERKLADAVFALLTHDDAPSRWQAVLRAAVGVEQLQAAGAGVSIGPIPRLSPEWVQACLGPAPGAGERLAAALGSAAACHASQRSPVDGIRHHWLPLEEGARRFRTTDKRLARDVRVVAHGLDPETDLCAILERRTFEAEKAAGRHPSLVAPRGAEACLSDLAAWIAGEVEPIEVLELARAFMAVDWQAWGQLGAPITLPNNRDFPEDAWCILRLNALPSAMRSDLDIPCDPAILRRLTTGDGPGALRLALRRLQAHGIRPALRGVISDPATTRKWASALAFPIAMSTAHTLLERIQPNLMEKHHDR